MKKSELVFNLISIPADIVMLFLAGIISFYLRQETTNIVGPIIYQLDLKDFLNISYKIIAALSLIFAFLGLYNLKGTRKFTTELGKIIVGVSLGLLIIMLLFFFNQSIFPSRFIILATWALGIIFVIFGRLVIKFVQRLYFFKGVGLHKLVIISGDNPLAKAVDAVYTQKQYGYEVVGRLKFDSGVILKLEELFKNDRLDEILQTDYLLSDEQNLRLVEFARTKGLSFSFVPNLFEVQRNVIEIYNDSGIPVIALKNTPLDGWGKVAKRIFDVFSSIICLILTLPLFIFISIAIKINSPGRVIYASPRGGKGNNFQFYKFRSMFSHLSVGSNYGGEGAEKIRQELWKKNDRGGENSPFLKIKKDPRVTSVGRFLRKTKLDEIPQFWNVLKGDMSMVGPRAHVLDEVQRYKDRYPRMFSIKPGIFGFSQVAQLSWPDLPFEEEIRLNIFYIENWSLWLDIKILIRSFVLLFFGKKNLEDY